MNWAETIRLNSPVQEHTRTRLRLLELLSRIKDEPLLEQVFVCENQGRQGDFILLLIWEAAGFSSLGSPLGLRLKQGLREMGMVDHAVWQTVSPPGPADLWK